MATKKHWFHDQMTTVQKKAYLKAHPNSKFGLTHREAGSKKPVIRKITTKAMKVQKDKPFSYRKLAGVNSETHKSLVSKFADWTTRELKVRLSLSHPQSKHANPAMAKVYRHYTKQELKKRGKLD